MPNAEQLPDTDAGDRVEKALAALSQINNLFDDAAIRVTRALTIYEVSRRRLLGRTVISDLPVVSSPTQEIIERIAFDLHQESITNQSQYWQEVKRRMIEVGRTLQFLAGNFDAVYHVLEILNLMFEEDPNIRGNSSYDDEKLMNEIMHIGDDLVRLPTYY